MLSAIEKVIFLKEVPFFQGMGVEQLRILAIALVRQSPDLSLELINVLSARLRDAIDRIAELTRTRPQALHKFYDEFS